MSTGSSSESRALYALAGFSAGALVFAVAVFLDPGLRTQGLHALLRPATMLAGLSPVFLGTVGWIAGRPVPAPVVRAPTPRDAPVRPGPDEETLERLHKQVAEARRQSKAKSDFLASMSHELRTPLNAIIGYSEMLTEDVEDGQMPQAHDLQRVTGSARHLLKVINDILDLSKIEVGKMSVLLEPVGVRKLVDEVRDTTAPLAAEKGNALVVELDPDLIRVRGDHMRLRQILINLLSNAFKFTENGTVTLIGSRVVDDKGIAWARIAVRDTGIGMSAEQVERVFADYTQASSEIKRRYGGTGLGLAISQKFASMMFGRIEVESEPGRGSTFTLALPLANLDEAPSVDGEIGRPKMWIVDGDPSARRLLGTLDKRGIDASVHPLDALAAPLQTPLPNMIVLDVDGQEAWGTLQELGAARAGRVIVASVDDAALERARDLGASFVRKPIDAEELVARCAQMMRT